MAAAVVAGLGLTSLTSVPNLSMVFLLAVFFAAVAFGIWPAMYASLLSFLAMNFFFIEPLYTLTVAEPHELLSLVIFLVVSVISATLAGRVREQVRLGVQRVRALRRLYEFTRKLSSLATVDTCRRGGRRRDQHQPGAAGCRSARPRRRAGAAGGLAAAR